MGRDEELQVQKEIRARLVRLRGQDLSDAAVAEEVSILKASGPAAVPVLLDQFADEDETLWAVATQALKGWDEPRPVEALATLLRNPRIHDLAKALILTILERYGLDVDDPDVLGLGINLEDYRVEPDEEGGSEGQGR
jgi:HEAT repeat protein